MNNRTDPWEAEMSREFDQRVRDLHEAPLTLDHVKGKAKKIRRTRRIAAAGGVLAAAAVAIPVAVFAGQGLTDSGSGPQPAPQPNPTVTDPDSVGFGYLEGSTLHLADGSTVELPHRYDRATVLGDTVLASRNDDDTGFDLLDVIDGSRTPLETVEIVSSPVLSDDHGTVAYVERDGRLVTRWEGGEQVLARGLGTSAFVTSVTGCGAEADGCRVYVNDDTRGEPLVFDALGGRGVEIPGAIRINDADDSGLVTVVNDSRVEGSCGGIYDETVGDYVWEGCDNYLYALSPGSRHVDATHAYLDGGGNAYAAILDAATGKEVARLEPPEGFIRQTAWQDAEHLLATVYDPEGWSIYRLGVDGEVERVVGPSDKGEDITPAYTLLGGS